MRLFFELIVEGIPASVNKQGKTYQTWIHQVATLARTRWGDRPPLTRVSIRLEIIFFYEKYTQLDVDNIIKPIQDSLNNIVYIDDRLVFDVMARKRQLTGRYHLMETTVPLSYQIEQKQNFVYVRISEIEDIKDLRI